MLKRRNLKVLAAAIGVSVMSGFYSSPVWAALEDGDRAHIEERGRAYYNSATAYADNRDKAYYESAKAYADNRDQAYYESAKAYADNRDQAYYESAKAYADNRDQAYYESAKAYADNRDQAYYESAKAYADNRDQAYYESAKAYADQKDAILQNQITANKDSIGILNDKTQAITFKDGMTVVGSSLSVTQDLGVHGNTYFAGDMRVTGATGTFNVADLKNNDDENVTTIYASDGEEHTFVVDAKTGNMLNKGSASLADGTFIANETGAEVKGGFTVKGDQAVHNGLSVGVKSEDNNVPTAYHFTVDQNGKITTDGGANITGGLTADTANITGDATVGGTLNVKKDADFDANVNVDGTVTADKVVTNRVELGTTVVKEEGFYMKDANGNHTTKLEEGRLQVKSETGDISTVVKSEGVFVKSDDNTTVSKLTQEGLDVGGNFTVDAATGNTKIGGTLDVAGATTLASTLNVKDNADFDKNVNVDGRLDVADGASIKDGEGGMLNVTADGVGLHSDKENASSLAVTKSGVGLISDTAISMNAADAKMSLSADGIGLHEGESAATVTDAGIGLTTAKTSVTVTDNGATFIADKNVAEYTNINGDEITVTDGTNKTIVNSTDVSITNPDHKNSERINLSDLGQIDNLDQELQARSEYVEEGRGTAVGAINAEAAIRREEVARLDNRIDKVEDRLDKVGAMTAAIANLRTMGYDPCAPSEFSMSLGHYRGETGMALGFFHYPNRDFMLSFSVSTAGDEYMGGIGATWKFGRKTPEQLAEEIKAEEAKKALAKAEAGRKAAVAAKVKVQQAKHAKMQ